MTTPGAVPHPTYPTGGRMSEPRDGFCTIEEALADLVRGHGHMDGLRARDGGVLVRAGHTEGSVDLARLAGLKEAAVICEVVNPDGTMARLPDLRRFSGEHGLKMCTIEDLITFRR